VAPSGQDRNSVGPWSGFLASAVLLAEVFLFHRRVLFSRAWTIPWDLRDYHLPLAEFMARCLRAAELPLWDPYTYCGMPFYANLQTQFAYPPAWIFLTLSNLTGGCRLLEFLEWQVVLHVFLAGLLAFWLLRRMGMGRGAALLGGTVFQLGGYFSSQVQHLGAVCAGAWLPLAWLGVIELSKGFRWRWLAGLTLALAMSFLAGFPAVTTVVFASSLGLACLLAVLRRAPPRLVLWTAAATIWAGLLSSVQLLPALELARLSTAYSRGQFAGTGGGVPLVALVSLVIPNHHQIFDLSRYKLPWNPTFLYLYCGLAGLGCALIGLIGSPSRYRTPLALAAMGAALWMLGESTPVGRTVFLWLPAALRSPLYAEFAMVAFQLAMAALAALGSERLLTGRRAAFPIALVVLAAVDLIAAGSSRIMNTFRIQDEPAVSLAEFEGSAETLERVRALVNQTNPPARLESYRDSMRWANSAPMIGIPTAGGNDPLAQARILDVRRLFGRGQPWLRYWELADLDSRLPDLLNVRYLISWAPTAQPALEHPDWIRVADLPGHQIYENRRVLPRFFLVGRLHRAPDKQAALSALRSPEFDPRKEAIVEGHLPSVSSPGAAGQVRVLAYELREILLETEAPAPAFLVTSESYYPGWRAWIDDRPAELLLTNVAFRGLAIPAGRRRIRMRFEPAILWLGLTLSVLATGGLAGALYRG